MSKAKKPTVDDLTRKKLLYAKQFYLHGEQHARAKNPVDRMIAIHQFHIAVEIALKAVYVKCASSEEIKRDKGKTGLKHLYFEELLKAIKPHCSWITVPLEDFLLNKLNERRHMAQHEAEPIASEHLPEYQVHTKDFLVECFLNEFEVKFDELDLSGFILDSYLKGGLSKAKELIELGETYLSVAFSKLVYYEARFTSFSLRFGSIREFPSLVKAKVRTNLGIRPFEDDFPYSPEILKLSEAFIDVWEDFSKELEKTLVQTISVGGTDEWEDRNRFLDISPRIVFLNPQGEINTVSRKGEGPPRISDALWAYEYAVRCILDWQGHGFKPKWLEKDMKFFEWAKDQIEAKRKEASN